MVVKEDFSSSVKLETSESIKSSLLEAKKTIGLYKEAVKILARIESNFDNALGNSYDYFDGNVNTDLNKTEFEKKAQELSTKAKELNEKISINSAFYLLAQSKLGISSVDRQELNSLVQILLQIQEKAKKGVENDLVDGKLDEDSHIASDFVNYNGEKDKNKSVIEIITIGGYNFRFINLEDYNPPTSPQTIKIIDPKIRNIIVEGGILYGDSANNIDKTNPEIFEKWLVNFLDKTPDLLQKYEIENYRQLSPKQAIQISSEITTIHLDYDYEQSNSNSKIFDNDNNSVNELLDEGKGICTNYSHSVKVIFDSLKALQTIDTNQLANTYSIMAEANAGKEKRFTNKNAARRIITDHHQWNTFYTILPSGEIQGLMIDTTSADKNGQKMRNPDYTDSMFLFNLERMITEGLLTQEQKISHLEKWSQNPKNLKSASYKASTQEIGDYYLRKGNQKKSLDWYMKRPAIKDLIRIQKDYNISENIIDGRIQDLINNYNNLENNQDSLFIAEYFYLKKDYQKSIKYFLDDQSPKFIIKSAVMFIVSCIKVGNTEYENWKIDDKFISANKSSIIKKYPEEAKIIYIK